MSGEKVQLKDLLSVRRVSSSPLLPRLNRVTVKRKCSSTSQLTEFPVLYFKGNTIILLDKIGFGSFADIYKSTAVINGRETEIAVKVIKNIAASRRQRKDVNNEKEILLDLPRSPWIVSCWGIATIEDGSSSIINNIGGFVLEYCPFKDLNTVLRDSELYRIVGINDEKLKQWIGHAIKAVHFLHTQAVPIIHGDIKSPNFLVSKETTLKLCDFSLSRKCNKSSSLGNFRSTPLWGPPELFINGIYSIESDIYSLGIVIWEILYFWRHNYNYRPPFKFSDAYYVIGFLIKNPDERPPTDGILKDWLNLINSCWDTDVLKRPSAEEALNMYKNIITEK